MNLHGIAGPIISAVNPTLQAIYRVSSGYSTAADGSRVPAYQTPGALTGSIASDILTVSAVSQGVLAPGQALAGAGLPNGLSILAQLSGTSGGPGTYQTTPTPDVASEAMTTSLVVPAQVQALTFRDLTQIEGLNIEGTRVAIYLYGRSDNVVRPTKKGGDLITITSGNNAGVYLTAIVLEQWPDWAKVAATLQNQPIT